MGKNLVIVESPAKAKTISKILGADFTVMPSVGHIRDLPEGELGVDVANGYVMKYEISPGKTKVVNELKKAVKASDRIYLAPDPDREGEAIAWHLHEVLAPVAKGKEFLRVQYNEITPRAVTWAIEHPGAINMDRVNAQQARRAIDRFVGFDISRRLWRKVKGARSAGRVQTVALRLVCEREEKIRAFTPEPYWIVGAIVSKDAPDALRFNVRLSKINGEKADIRTEERASAVMADLEPRALRVAAVRPREIAKHALAPFITSSLQQAASSTLGFSPSRTMSLAQRLYEGVDLGDGTPVGLITYMRTDAPAVSQDARDAARAFIEDSYGRDFLPATPNVYRSRQTAQEAHEAIRPTDISRTPDSLTGKLDPAELKLYDLIWRRFIASQMAPARLLQRVVEVEAVPGATTSSDTYIFTATSTEVTFDGFLKVMKLDIRKSLRAPEGREADDETDDDADDVETLPALADGEALRRIEWLSDRKETKPPTRYSEASLIKAMEENGVGRPSTYASIIETLHDREYVAKTRKPLQPTVLGDGTCHFLVQRFPTLFDVAFTAKMEEDLDEVEEGKVDWRKLLETFHGEFEEWLKDAPADPATVRAVLAECDKITKWNEPVKRGRRVIDDSKFFNSVRSQFDSGRKSLTGPQLESLVKTALRYEDQIPGVRERIRALGFGDIADTMVKTEPPPLMKEKFDLLLSLEMPERQRTIAESIKSQMDAHRALSAKQIALVDSLLLRMAPSIENASEKLGALGIKVAEEALAPDTESPGLIEKLSRITTWKPAVKRGRRVFDDKAFAQSLSDQFARSGSLTPRQRAALSKLLGRYKDQVGE